MADTAALVAQRAAALVSQGHHWSDATVLAVGEHLWGGVDWQVVRMAMAFGGGVGGTQQELCGALSGGVMLIGALFAPQRPGEDEELLRQTVARFRDRFLNQVGPTQCAALRDGLYGADGEEPCSVLVQRAVRILLQVLHESGGVPGVST